MYNAATMDRGMQATGKYGKQYIYTKLNGMNNYCAA